jgi:predicted AlkP superfamily pyrophosphatase or phosphodiesterase
MRKTVVINVVGLTPGLLGDSTPRLRKFAEGGGLSTVVPQVPAVTCTAQATYLTGVRPDRHGIVANGWYFREESEIKFWRQSNRLVKAPKVWEAARKIDPEFTCANMFWWYNMYSSVDYSATPRPMYPADGRKIPDVYTQPPALRPALQEELGQFPLFNYWGPNSSIDSSRWIAESAKWVDARHDPTLTLIYLPHLDYGLQKYGPDREKMTQDLREIDAVCGGLIDHYEARDARIILLSEYGITPISRPVHINRLLRENGLLALREELDRELLDAGASAAFAVADHQIAHVYVDEPRRVPDVRAMLEEAEGIERVLDEESKRELGLDHPRSGELVAIAEPDAFFTYYYWLDDARAPDFARTVDIHRKPGFDPTELFVDPGIRYPRVRVATRLLQKQLGFRCLMDVVPLDASLVRGSHGRPTGDSTDGPLLITRQTELLEDANIEAPEVYDLILKHLQNDSKQRFRTNKWSTPRGDDTEREEPRDLQGN